MRIRDLLNPACIKLNGSARDKADVIEQMVSLMANSGNISDIKVYHEGVLAREKESTTAVGEGVAIPHCKSDSVKAPCLAAMTLPSGVDYDSPDGEPVKVIFLIAAPNSKENVHVDVLEIIDLLNSLRHEPPDPGHMRKTERLMELFQGDIYLTGDILNGQSTLNWLHNEYLSAVYRYIELLKTHEEYTRICDVCRRASRIDDLDEQLHIELMQAMINLNRSDEAAAEYRRLAKQSREYLDVEPGEELQACYDSLAEAGKTIRINLDTIRNELIEKEGGTMRNLERLGSSMFLGVIMLGDVGDNSSDVRRESCMAGLQQILKSNMRKGDIITRFSDNTYAMLLPTVSYSTGNMVMDRIENLYYQEYSSLAINFFARISPLGTSDF